MTPFGQQLAEFEMWTALHEPAASPAVSSIIDRHYRSRGFSGLGDTVSDIMALPDFPDDGAPAATDTANVLTSFFNSAGNLFNNQAQTAQRLQQLQTTAEVQRAQAAGAASNNNTMLMVGGVFAGLIALALLAKSR